MLILWVWYLLMASCTLTIIEHLSICAFWYFAHLTFYFFSISVLQLHAGHKTLHTNVVHMIFLRQLLWVDMLWLELQYKTLLRWHLLIFVRYLLVRLLTWLLVEKWSVWNWVRAFTCWSCVTSYTLFLPCIVHFD